jgi:hypothetical protein
MRRRPVKRSRTQGKETKVRVRMYRQGLGDCFLVTFNPATKPVHILIDCGTLGARTTNVKMPDVIEDIKKTTEGHLDVLVATHEHKDHVSGFGGSPSPFDEFKVDRVWVAWTEDPDDPFAKKISKHKGDLRMAVAFVADAIAPDVAHDPDEQKSLSNVKSGMHEIMGFFGVNPSGGEPLAAALAKGIDNSMRYVTERAGDDGRFLSPGELIEEKWLPGVRVYVLGPPRDESALRNMGEHGSASLYSLTDQLTTDLQSCSRFGLSRETFHEYVDQLDADERQQFESRLPFDRRFRVETANTNECEKCAPAYFADENAWRRIDQDWLDGGSNLALQLDSYTNNTSLVLAFELVEDGRVLLFAADAQQGNWLSWHDPALRFEDSEGKDTGIRTRNLLERTVFYKVGHHSSHNATVKAEGLELMQREDLVAMIPVDRKVALNKSPPWQMPADALYKRLVEKTSGRVLRSDTGWPSDAHRPASTKEEEWVKTRNEADINVTDLYIDYELR